MISKQLIEQLMEDEGYRLMPYRCTEGYLTVGYGYNMDANELKLTSQQLRKIRSEGLPKQEAYQLLLEVLRKREKTLRDKIPWLSKMTQPRIEVFINMSYQLGEKGFFKFKRTIAAAERGEYATCAAFMLQSKWAKQTPNRAKRMADQMRTGVPQ